MASEVVTQRGHTPSSVRQPSHTHTFPENVSVGQLVLVSASGYSDLDPTDTFSAADISQSAGTATLGPWIMHATGERDAGSIEAHAVGYSAIVTGAGSLTVQIAKAVDRYWTLGGTVLNGIWDGTRAEAGANSDGNFLGPNVTLVTGPELSSAGPAVFVGVVAHNSSGGTSSLTTGGGYTPVWEEPNASQYCVGAMSIRVEGSAQTNLAPSWTFGGGLATNGGVAIAHFVLREGAPPDVTPPTLTGTVTPSAVGPNTATISWPAGSDDVAVTSYEYSLNGGSYVDVGNVTTTNLTGLTPSTLYNVSVRAKDAGNNVSTPAITGSFTTGDPGPDITGSSTATPAYQGSITFTGTNFGAVQGTKVFQIGGITQTVTSWADTSITISSVNRGTNKYGVPLNAEIYDSAVLVSNQFALTSLVPPAGTQYVNIGTPEPLAANRITATPDLISGNQVAAKILSGITTLILFDNGTFFADTYGTFEFEVHDAVDGWGATAVQIVEAPEAGPIAGLMAAISIF